MNSYLPKFKRLQFTEYRNNKSVVPIGFNEFKKDIKNKNIKFGILKISPQFSEEIFKWRIANINNTMSIKPEENIFKMKFSSFKNSILSLLRVHGILAIILRVRTGQFHNGKEISELWGYRLFLLNKCVVLEKLSSESIYSKNTIKKNDALSKPELDTVYCGPDGKIFGWDKV